jgi:hypothetical protein
MTNTHPDQDVYLWNKRKPTAGCSNWFILFIWFIRSVWFNQTNKTNQITTFICWRTFQHPAIYTKGGRSSQLLPPLILVKSFATYSAAGYSASRALHS